MPVKSASPLTMYLSLRASRTLLYGHVKKCRYLCTKHCVGVDNSVRIQSFYPEGPKKSDSYGRIISRGHLNRLQGYLEKTQGECTV